MRRLGEAIRRSGGAVFFYLLCAMILLYPLSRNISNSLPQPFEDPLLNCFILSWDITHFYEGWSDFWNGNTFFPSSGTLAFSENLLGDLPAALIIYHLSHNVLTVHNILLILSFPLTGLGAYLLVHRLSGDRVASFFAGLFFAFAPYRISHIFHLNLLTAQWIPLTLLFWYESLETGNPLHLILFSLFLDLQFLSCIHYGLFLFFLLPIITAIYMAKRGVEKKRLLFISIAYASALILLTPIYMTYAKVRHELGMLHPPAPLWSADLFSLITPPEQLNIWGWAKNVIGKGESSETTLFPGIMPLFFSIYYLRSKGMLLKVLERERRSALHWAIDLLIAFVFIITLAISVTGGAAFSIGSIHIGMHTASIPSTILLFLLLLRFLIRPGIRKKIGRFWVSSNTEHLLLLAILFIGLLFSFYGPFLVLSKIAPPFSSMRVPARFFILSLLALSIFAGSGVSACLQEMNKGKRRVWAVFMTVAILLEFMAFPVSINFVSPPSENSAPPVYKVIKERDDARVIVELPFYSFGCAPLYMLYSQLHRKKIVNGISGIIPRYYENLIELFDGPPEAHFLRALGDFQVDYLILHERYLSPGRYKELKSSFDKDERFEFEGRWGDSDLYRIHRERLPSSHEAKKRFPPLSKKGWKITAPSLKGLWESAGSAIDGNTRSYWTTGRPGLKGDSLTIDMGERTVVEALGFSLGTDFRTYPRAYDIEVSEDGSLWRRVGGEGNSYPPFSSYFENPGNPEFTCAFNPVTTRFIRINLSANSNNPWGAHEINIYGRPK